MAGSMQAGAIHPNYRHQFQSFGALTGGIWSFGKSSDLPGHAVGPRPRQAAQVDGSRLGHAFFDRISGEQRFEETCSSLLEYKTRQDETGVVQDVRMICEMQLVSPESRSEKGSR